MHWIRTNRRFGTWCALAAIALQIVLSFGHVHCIDGLRSGGPLQAAAAYGDKASGQGAPSPTSSLAIESCAICIAINMAGSTVPPAVPAWGSPLLARGMRLAPSADAAAATLAHRRFQARAPPSA